MQLLDIHLFKLMITAGMAAIPVVELRGAIPFGISLGLSAQAAFLASFVGNMLPVPFIILFIRRIFSWLRKYPKWESIINRMEKRAQNKGKLVNKFHLLGLCLLVAIPLPGTGAWTGSLVAGILELRMRDALIAICLGVLIAGAIVLSITYGLINAFQ
jgi:uncharacterized membrane protein